MFSTEKRIVQAFFEDARDNNLSFNLYLKLNLNDLSPKPIGKRNNQTNINL